MAHKFEGPWRLRFIRITESGEIVVTERGTFHIHTIGAGGNIDRATDVDGTTPLQGHVSKAGPFDTIHFNRTQAPLRHFRGVQVFQDVDGGGELHLALAGQRKIGPFPDSKDDEDEAVQFDKDRKDRKDRDLAGQEDGVWVATKP